MRPRWWALPAAAAGCLLFVALGVALIASGGPGGVAIGVIAIAFFGGGLVLLVVRRPWRWSIVIDDRGVAWRRPRGEMLVRWENIAAIRFQRGSPTGFVTLTLHDPSAVDQAVLGRLNRPLQAFNRSLTGGEASIAWNERDRSAEDLAGLLAQRLDVWTQAHPPSGRGEARGAG
jgi:hypothetical protein